MIAQHREDGNVVEGHRDNTRDGVNVTKVNGLSGVPYIMGHTNGKVTKKRQFWTPTNKKMFLLVSGPVDSRNVRMTSSNLLEWVNDKVQWGVTIAINLVPETSFWRVGVEWVCWNILNWITFWSKHQTITTIWGTSTAEWIVTLWWRANSVPQVQMNVRKMKHLFYSAWSSSSWLVHALWWQWQLPSDLRFKTN